MLFFLSPLLFSLAFLRKFFSKFHLPKANRRKPFPKRRRKKLFRRFISSERRFNFIFRAFVNCFFCKPLFISVVCGRECRIYSIKCKVYLSDWKVYCTFAAELKNVSLFAICEASIAEGVFEKPRIKKQMQYEKNRIYCPAVSKKWAWCWRFVASLGLL